MESTRATRAFLITAPVLSLVVLCLASSSGTANNDSCLIRDMTTDWLAGVLSREGYEIVSNDKVRELFAKHAQRPNMVVKIFAERELILFVHWWRTKEPGWLSDAQRIKVLNNLNIDSLTQTFSIDRDGDLLVSTYIASSDPVSSTTIRMFLERDTRTFAQATEKHNLSAYLK